MGKSRFTEEQIVSILREAEEGASIPMLCRKYGVSDTTVYGWRIKFQIGDFSGRRYISKLIDENDRLKKILAEQALDIQMLREQLENAPRSQAS